MHRENALRLFSEGFSSGDQDLVHETPDQTIERHRDFR
jgi:hypothetical protein